MIFIYMIWVLCLGPYEMCEYTLEYDSILIQHHKITYFRLLYCLNSGFKYSTPIAIAHFNTTFAMAFIHTFQTQIDSHRNASANRKVASKSHMFYTLDPRATPLTVGPAYNLTDQLTVGPGYVLSGPADSGPRLWSH